MWSWSRDPRSSTPRGVSTHSLALRASRTRLDVFVTKTVTPEPRAGNPPVRIAETDVGMLNSIGLANPGIERFRDEHLPALERLGVPLWVSVGGFSASDFARCCAALDDEPGVEAIELNVSCPNVTAPADAAAAIVEAARGATSKPLYAKLSPALPDVPAVALAAEAAGAEGLSLTNTLRGLTIDTENASAADRDGDGRALRAGASARCASCRVWVRACDPHPHRRHGWHRDRRARPRVSRGRRVRRRARHRAVRRPARAAACSSRARASGGAAWVQRSGRRDRLGAWA